MSEARGTLESLLREMAIILSPLTSSFAPDNALAFFSQLGIPLTSAQANALSATLTSAANRIRDFLKLSNELSVAIDVNDASVSMTSLECVAKLKDALGTFNDIAYAIGNLGLPGINPSVIPDRLFNYLIIRKLSPNVGLKELLEFGGILERTDHNIHSNDPDHPFYTIDTFHFDRIGGWLDSPSAQLQNLYGWGNASFDGAKLLEVLNKLLAQLGVPLFLDSLAVPPKLDALLIELEPKTTINPKGVLLRFNANITSGVLELAERDWNLTLNLGFTIPSGTEIIFQPNGQVTIQPPDNTTASGKIRWSAGIKRDPEHPMLLLGQSGGSRVQVQEISVFAEGTFAWKGTRAEGTISLGGDLKGGKILLSLQEGDGFLQKILSGLPSLENSFDVGFGLSQQEGLHFNGSSALEIQLASHTNLGLVKLTALTFSIGINGSKFPISISSNLKTSLGPLVASVENVGVTFDVEFTPNRDGNGGLLDISPKFKPPNGVRLLVDAGGFKGGGFLDFIPQKEEYSGALELEFQRLFSVKALGIINTRLPDGAQGFSLLILITAEFIPIQLGFGFTLNGVGGLLGLDRTVRVEPLRDGVRTNAVKSILFPENIIDNISRILSDLKQIFPPEVNHFTFGPMGKLGWGTPSIITLELGLVLDLPTPKFLILGVLKVVLPEESAPLLRLQVNFLGGVDFDKGELFFDASLYDSRLLTFALVGDMVLRLSWSSRPIFILTVGGFHPDFKEAPPELWGLRRLGIHLLSGDNPRLSVDAYFAVTSNTVQFGARAELYAEAMGFNVWGFLGYDVLFQFDPFRFSAALAAGLALRRGTNVIRGIYVEALLSGPTPWRIRGEVTFAILFEITIPFSHTWGERESSLPKATEDVLALLKAAVADSRNWRAELPPLNNIHVSLRQSIPLGNEILVHPFGTLILSQKVVPLGVNINKFGNKKPMDVTHFELSSWRSDTTPLASEPVKEQFAPGNFFELSDAEKLSRKSFESMPSGAKITPQLSLHAPLPVERVVNYELIYTFRRRFLFFHFGLVKFASLVFQTTIKASAAAKSALSIEAVRPSAVGAQEVKIETPRYALVNVSDMQLHEADLWANSETEAYHLYQNLVTKNPALRDQIQVVSHYEL
jgi:hypothetical protein